MVSERTLEVIEALAITGAIALAGSLCLGVPYIFSVVGVLAWGFFGFVVTLDDDLPGGWSPDPGGRKAVFLRLLLAAAALVAAVAVAVLFPAIRAAGGAH